MVHRKTGAPQGLAGRQACANATDAEIAEVERLVAAEALSWPEVKRLMTSPSFRGLKLHL